MSRCHTGQNSFHHATFLCSCTTTIHSVQPLATILLADTILLRLFTSHTLPYINTALGLSFLGGGILEPLRWDRQFVPKRRQEIAATHCVITQKSAVLYVNPGAQTQFPSCMPSRVSSAYSPNS